MAENQFLRQNLFQLVPKLRISYIVHDSGPRFGDILPLIEVVRFVSNL